MEERNLTPKISVALSFTPIVFFLKDCSRWTFRDSFIVTAENITRLSTSVIYNASSFFFVGQLLSVTSKFQCGDAIVIRFYCLLTQFISSLVASRRLLEAVFFMRIVVRRCTCACALFPFRPHPGIPVPCYADSAVERAASRRLTDNQPTRPARLLLVKQQRCKHASKPSTT